MRRLLTLTVSLAISLLFFGIGIQFIRDYFGITDIKTKDNATLLIAKGKKIVATIDPDIKKDVIWTPEGNKSKFFYKYSFNTNGENYTGKWKTFKNVSSFKLEVFYLPDNPNVNMVDPEYQLEIYESLKGDIKVVYIGIFLLLISGFSLYLVFSKYKFLALVRRMVPNQLEKSNNNPGPLPTNLLRKINRKNIRSNKDKTRFESERVNNSTSIKAINEDKQILKTFSPSNHEDYKPKP